MSHDHGQRYTTDNDTPTRTLMPGGTPGGTPLRPRSSRNLMAVVGVVVLLVAAIAFANRGGDDGQPGAGGTGEQTARADSTAPTGVQPVQDKNAGIASGFARTEQGVQSAAANFATALGGDSMLKADARHAVVDAVYTAESAAELKAVQDKAYSAEFLKRLGLDPAGNPPAGKTFISRTIPVGTKIIEFTTTSATVAVWHTGLIGMAGIGSTDPVRTDWKTWTFELLWTADGWRVVTDSQRNGPAPVPGDVPASGAEELSEAVEEYGGFTYAR